MGMNNCDDYYELVYSTAVGKAKPPQDAAGCVTVHTTAALMRWRRISIFPTYFTTINLLSLLHHAVFYPKTEADTAAAIFIFHF